VSYQPHQQPWVVYNPWVFANYGQPQRQRGYVSPVAFKTHPPSLGSDSALAGIAGVAAVIAIIYLGAKEIAKPGLQANRRRRRRR
jgi:hypothetical protein